MLNLLSNAFKFTMQGSGTVGTSAGGKLRRSFGGGHGSNRHPDSELPHIFERFHRVEGTKGRSFEGTGIGLALISELVKLHGGDVRVRSKLGSRSTASPFRFHWGVNACRKSRLIPAASGLNRAVSGAAFLEEAQTVALRRTVRRVSCTG